VFAILRWKEIKNMPSYKNNLLQTLGFLVLGFVFVLIPVRHFIEKFPENSYFLFYYPPIIIGLILIFTGVFNIKFVKRFSSELMVVPYMFFAYAMIQVIINSWWMHFVDGIIYILGLILPLITKSVFVDPGEALVVMEGFYAKIGPPCSGIYSLVSFLFLYLASMYMLAKKHKINWMKSAAALLAGLAFVFILNIFRIIILIAVGAYYSKELAYNLFHEYLSAIFLIGLFVMYLYFVFPRIIKPQEEKNSL
jgi:exosortase/archaeosortase family protein